MAEVGDFPRQRVEVIRAADPECVLGERFYRRGWTDGLPVTAPTLGRVDEMVRAGGRGHPRPYLSRSLLTTPIPTFPRTSALGLSSTEPA